MCTPGMFHHGVNQIFPYTKFVPCSVCLKDDTDNKQNCCGLGKNVNLMSSALEEVCHQCSGYTKDLFFSTSGSKALAGV